MSVIRFDKLTMDEVERIEELTGLRMEQMMTSGQVPSAKTIKAFTLIALQRKNPDADMADVGKMSYSDCIDLLADGDPVEEDATPKAGKRAGTAKSAPN